MISKYLTRKLILNYQKTKLIIKMYRKGKK